MQQARRNDNEEYAKQFSVHPPSTTSSVDSPTHSLKKSVSAVAGDIQRKVSSIDQMAQFSSYYDVKGFGSQNDSVTFMEEVGRRKSVVSTLLLPMAVSSGCAAITANQVADRLIVRSISVGKTNSQLIPEYKLEDTNLPSLVLLHFGRVRLIWDWTILLLVAYLSIMLPFNVAFKAHHNLRPFFIADFFLEFIFITDILLNFRTTYINPKTGRLVAKPKKIAKNYLKHWFALDLIATMPFDILYFSKNELINIVAILKLIRLLRLFRIGRRVSRSIEYTGTLLVLMMFSFALLSHWLACIWYVIGYEELNDEIRTGWLVRLGDQVKKPYPHSVNVTAGGPSYSEEYISALYFIFTSLTTVGFGNIAPNTVMEKTFSVIILILGAMLQSAIFGNMTAVIQKLYASRARFHAKASQIKQFVHLHQIDGNLRKRIEDWFISHWSVSKGVDTEEMLESFPSELQADICLYLYRRFLTMPCFAHASRGCLRSISSKVKKANFSPGELIIKEKDAINTLFFVQRGTVEIVQRDFIVAILGTGDLFGEDICKHNPKNRRSNGDVKALMYCEILYLSCDSMKDVVRFYPDFAEMFTQSVRLSFDLSARAKSLHGLSSIVEESENQSNPVISSLSSATTSDEESDEEDIIPQQKRKCTLRNSGIPLWQIRSMKNSPTPSLKKKLMKLDSMSVSSDGGECKNVCGEGRKHEEEKDDNCTKAVVDDVCVDIELNDVNMSLNSTDSNSVLQNFDVVDDRSHLDEVPVNNRQRSGKWTPTSFRRNRYVLTYFARGPSPTNEISKGKETTVKIIGNANYADDVSMDNDDAKRQSSSSLPEELFTSLSKRRKSHVPKITSKSHSLRLRRRNSAKCEDSTCYPKVFKNLRTIDSVELDDNNYSNDDDDVIKKTSVATDGNNTGLTHLDVPAEIPPSIVVYSDFETSLEADLEVDQRFLSSPARQQTKQQNHLLDDFCNEPDQGIYSQCSDSSVCAVDTNILSTSPARKSKSLSDWIEQVRFASSTLDKETEGNCNVTNTVIDSFNSNQHLRNEITTLRNEMKDLKSGMIALTDLVRFSIYRENGKDKNQESGV